MIHNVVRVVKRNGVKSDVLIQEENRDMSVENEHEGSGNLESYKSKNNQWRCSKRNKPCHSLQKLCEAIAMASADHSWKRCQIALNLLMESVCT